MEYEWKDVCYLFLRGFYDFIFSYLFGESKFFKVVGVFVRRLDF